MPLILMKSAEKPLFLLLEKNQFFQFESKISTRILFMEKIVKIFKVI